MRNSNQLENLAAPLCALSLSKGGHLPHKGGEMQAANVSIPTSPLRREVAAKRRVGVTRTTSLTLLANADVLHITPPRSFAPTLPLKGRVSSIAEGRATP
jgi:hypothetical protein